jgi:hypothetical protein
VKLNESKNAGATAIEESRHAQLLNSGERLPFRRENAGQRILAQITAARTQHLSAHYI